jgi:hypothetical protein
VKKIAISIVALASAIGCHGQLPPSPPPTAVLTWTASPSCTSSAPCVYVISRATVTGSTCPATTGTAYTLVITTPANALTAVDGTVPTGTLNCWIAQAQTQTTPVLTSVPSGASNGGVPFALPALPLAPGSPNATGTAKAELPAAPAETVARFTTVWGVAPLNLTAICSSCNAVGGAPR